MAEHPSSEGTRADSFTSGSPSRFADARESGEPAPLSGSGQYTRRRLLKIGAGGAILASGVYAGLSVLDRDESAGEVTAVAVPAGSFLLGTITGNTLLAEAEFRTELDEAVTTESTVDSTTALLTSIESTTGIDISAVETVTTFARYSEDSVGGALVFETSVGATTLGQRLEQADALADETNYSGHRLFEIDNAGLPVELTAAILPDGELAVGSRPEIEGVIDVTAGEGSTVQGPVLDAAGRAADGFLSVGFTLPVELEAAEELPQFLQHFFDGAGIEYGYATLLTDPAGLLTITFETASSSHASDLASQIRLVSLLDGETVGELIDLPPALRDDVVALLQDLSVETDGSLVTLRIPDGFALVAQGIRLVLEEN